MKQEERFEFPNCSANKAEHKALDHGAKHGVECKTKSVLDGTTKKEMQCTTN